MTDLNSLTNIAAIYPNVFVEGSEIYLGSKGSPKRINLYPVTFEWFDGDLTKLDWTECQFVDAYLSELSKHWDFIEMFINGEFPVRSKHWAKVCDVINDCFLKSCVWDVVKNREYEFLTSSTYRIETDGRIYRNDVYPHIPIISEKTRLQEYFGWMFSDKYGEEYFRDFILSHNSECNKESIWSEEKYTSIGEDIAGKFVYALAKFDFSSGIDWSWILDECSKIDPRLGDSLDAYLHPANAPKAGIVSFNEITLENAPSKPPNTHREPSLWTAAFAEPALLQNEAFLLGQSPPLGAGSLAATLPSGGSIAYL
jgi:hypothetical protein